MILGNLEVNSYLLLKKLSVRPVRSTERLVLSHVTCYVNDDKKKGWGNLFYAATYFNPTTELYCPLPFLFKKMGEGDSFFPIYRNYLGFEPCRALITFL